MTSAAQKRLFDALDGDAGKQGWRHTLTEIFQQPELWHQTAEFSASVASRRLEQVRRNRFLVLTGSGSSHYVGECIAAAIQRGAARSAQALGSGELLLAKRDLLPLQRPLMLVSFARSGSSPESTALISDCLEQEPSIEHLVVTCNPSGKLARQRGSGSESGPRFRSKPGSGGRTARVCRPPESAGIVPAMTPGPLCAGRKPAGNRTLEKPALPDSQ